MLIQAGLIEGECSQAIGRQPDCTAYAITWQGYEFLNSVRNITIGNRTLQLTDMVDIDNDGG